MNPHSIDYALNKLFRPAEAELFSMGDVLLAMMVSTLLCFVLIQVYQSTHRGTSYSHSFIQTLFLMGISTSVVMMVIGSNIARAFSLVGALSVIRFRTAVKDSRDTGYLYAAMVVGMGCGTDFYMPAILFTTFVSILMLLIHYLDFGRRANVEYLVRVTSKKGEETRNKLRDCLNELFDECRLVNRIHDRGEDKEICTFLVRSSRGREASKECEAKLADTVGISRFSVYEADQETPL